MKKPNIKKLRQQAHHLKPVILIGDKGFTPAVLTEINIALEHHELIKIKVPSSNQEDFHNQVVEIANAANATVIQAIGHMLVLYRKSEKET